MSYNQKPPGPGGNGMGGVPPNGPNNSQQVAKTLAGIQQQMQNLVHGQNALPQTPQTDLNVFLQQQQRIQNIFKHQQQQLFQQHFQQQMQQQQHQQQQQTKDRGVGSGGGGEPLALTRTPAAADLLNKTYQQHHSQHQQQPNGSSTNNAPALNQFQQQLQAISPNIMQQIQAFQYQFQQQQQQQQQHHPQTQQTQQLHAGQQQQNQSQSQLPSVSPHQQQQQHHGQTSTQQQQKALSSVVQQFTQRYLSAAAVVSAQTAAAQSTNANKMGSTPPTPPPLSNQMKPPSLPPSTQITPVPASNINATGVTPAANIGISKISPNTSITAAASSKQVQPSISLLPAKQSATSPTPVAAHQQNKYTAGKASPIVSAIPPPFPSHFQKPSTITPAAISPTKISGTMSNLNSDILTIGNTVDNLKASQANPVQAIKPGTNSLIPPIANNAGTLIAKDNQATVSSTDSSATVLIPESTTFSSSENQTSGANLSSLTTIPISTAGAAMDGGNIGSAGKDKLTQGIANTSAAANTVEVLNATNEVDTKKENNKKQNHVIGDSDLNNSNQKVNKTDDIVASNVHTQSKAVQDEPNNVESNRAVIAPNNSVAKQDLNKSAQSTKENTDKMKDPEVLNQKPSKEKEQNEQEKLVEKTNLNASVDVADKGLSSVSATTVSKSSIDTKTIEDPNKKLIDKGESLDAASKESPGISNIDNKVDAEKSNKAEPEDIDKKATDDVNKPIDDKVNNQVTEKVEKISEKKSTVESSNEESTGKEDKPAPKLDKNSVSNSNNKESVSIKPDESMNSENSNKKPVRQSRLSKTTAANAKTEVGTDKPNEKLSNSRVARDAKRKIKPEPSTSTSQPASQEDSRTPSTPTNSTIPQDSSSNASSDRKSQRHRLKTILYQSPLPELAYITKLSASEASNSPKPMSVDDRLIVFYKNEYMAVRNAERTFYLCQTMQNVYRTSPRISIRWLSEDAKDNTVYKPDFYDHTDIECVLTTVDLKRIDKGHMRLPETEKLRIESILRKAIDVENGTVPRPELTEENPDGLDLSLYKDESQIEKKTSGGVNTVSPGISRKSKRSIPNTAKSANLTPVSTSKTKRSGGSGSGGAGGSNSGSSASKKRKLVSKKKKKSKGSATDDDMETSDESDTDYRPNQKKSTNTSASKTSPRAQRSPLAKARVASPITPATSRTKSAPQQKSTPPSLTRGERAIKRKQVAESTEAQSPGSPKKSNNAVIPSNTTATNTKILPIPIPIVKTKEEENINATSVTATPTPSKKLNTNDGSTTVTSPTNATTTNSSPTGTTSESGAIASASSINNSSSNSRPTRSRK